METRTEASRPPESRSVPAPGDRPATGVDSAKPKRRPPLWAILIGAIVVIAAVLWGARYLAYASTHQTTDDARVDGDTVTVTSKISERVAAILTNTNDGVRKGQILIRLDDRDERTRVEQAQAAVAAQRAQASAAFANVELTREQQAAQSLQSGGGVTAARAQITNARANASAADEQIGVARAGVAQAQAQLRQAQAQVPSAQQALARADADLSRVSSLVRTGDLAQQQLDAQRAAQAQALAQYRGALDQATAAQTAVAQAQARLTGAGASALAAQAGIGAQQGQLETAQGRLVESNAPSRVPAVQAQANAAAAQVGALSAQAQTAADQLQYTVIRSPIDGTIGAKNVEAGATVAPGQSLLQIVPNTGLYVTANFKETQLGAVKAGQDVDLSIDAYKGTTFHGRVESIGPASQNTFSLIPAQNATGNFVKVTQRLPVRIHVVDPPADKPLRVGMSATASVRVK